jgi:hypothetical protein
MMPATMAPIVLFIVYISSPYYLDLDLINHQLNQTENFLTITNCI